ncbi:MAG: DUF3160 domain-containing protein [Myxococcales bacterium]|nr:DUF3160 domain-containing protein [Myxococcales bacterium]
MLRRSSRFATVSLLSVVSVASCFSRPQSRAPVPLVASAGDTRIARPLPPAPQGSYRAPSRDLSFEELREQMPGTARIPAETMLARHAPQFAQAPQYNLAQVAGIDTIQRGPYALVAAEQAMASSQGFALLPRLESTNFLGGYTGLFVRDQPVYLSADAVTTALHESFDALIASVEKDALLPALTDGLAQIQQNLRAANELSPEVRGDLDVYVASTLGALRATPVAPVANGDAALVATIYTKIQEARGPAGVRLFGVDREVDFSQMRPRGHYAGDAVLERYFRAVMWLGREGLRLIDVQGSRKVVARRQVEAALALHALSDARTRAAFALLEDTITQFAGEPEALGFRDLDTIAERVSAARGLRAIDDARLAAVIDEVRGVRPRVATSMLVHPEGWVGTVPQPVQFSLTAQRYTPDSRVLSHVSYDRIDQGRAVRMVPSPLDAAFGAFGNDQALGFVREDLQRYQYATELETTRVLIDAHPQSYWQGSLYASWLSALRTLSPRETLADAQTLPATMSSEAWGRRLLQTQLAAWAEIRHDTVLYTAQSYSVSLGCSFPQAYVDPYPALWNGLARWSERAAALIERTPWRDRGQHDRWARWAQIARASTERLERIALRERRGEDMTADDLAWMNDALHAREVNVVCATEVRLDGGWLYDLYEPHRTMDEARAVVADVHTAPEDEHGSPAGFVLHVGTAAPQAMIVIAGPRGRERAYLGYAYGYRERVTRNFQRLTDQEWRAHIGDAQAPAWTASITAPRGR